MNEKQNEITADDERNLIESYLTALDGAANLIEEHLIPILSNQINQSDSEAAKLGTFYRLFLLTKGILALNDRQHFQLVMAAMRTIFELLVDLRLLSLEPSAKYVSMYTKYADVARFHTADKLAEFAIKTNAQNSVRLLGIDLAKSVAADHARRVKVEGIVRNLWGETKNKIPNYPQHWSGMDLRKRSKLLGEYYEVLYLQIYSFASWYTHSGPAGYAGVDPDGLGRIFGIAVETSRLMLIDAFKLIVNEFHLSKVLNVSEMTEFLEGAPERIFIDKFKQQRL